MQRGVVVVGVLFEGVAEVEGVLLLDVVAVLAHAEGDAVHGAATVTVGKLELEVLQLTTDTPTGAVVAHMHGGEDGPLVLWAEWLHAFEVGHELGVDVAEGDDGVDVYLWRHLLRADVACGLLHEAVDEGLEVLLTQGETSGVHVSAKVFEDVTTGLDGAVDVEARDGACRSGDEFG